VAARLLLFGGVFFLYKKDIFVKQSTFFLKEILLLGAGLVFLQVSDFLASECMWKSVGNTVRKYTNYSDNCYVDDKKYEKIKELYKKKQE